MPEHMSIPSCPKKPHRHWYRPMLVSKMEPHPLLYSPPTPPFPSHSCPLLHSLPHLDMRKVGSSRGAVSAYPRQLESLIRLAEAHSKMRLSNVVEIVDVEEAKRCGFNTFPNKVASILLSTVGFTGRLLNRQPQIQRLVSLTLASSPLVSAVQRG